MSALLEMAFQRRGIVTRVEGADQRRQVADADQLEIALRAQTLSCAGARAEPCARRSRPHRWPDCTQVALSTTPIKELVVQMSLRGRQIPRASGVDSWRHHLGAVSLATIVMTHAAQRPEASAYVAVATSTLIDVIDEPALEHGVGS